MATISELRQARSKAEDELKALGTAMVEKAEVGGEEYDAANKAFDAKEAEIADLTKKIDAIVEAEQKAARAGKVRELPEGTLGFAVPKSVEDKEAVKSAPKARMIAHLVECHTNGAIKAMDFVEREYGPSVAGVLKGHQLSDYSTGGALSLPDFAETIIEGLENMTVVRKMRPQVLNVPGAMILPKETSAPNGSWLAENGAPTPGTFAFGDIRIDPKRLPIEAVVSRRLLDQAARGGSAVRNLEGYITRRLQERLAVNEDAGFLRGAGTEYVPLGLRSQIASANVKAIAGSSAANIESDLRSRITVLQEGNVMITDGYWVMPPRTRAYLADLRDANGNKIYPSIDANNTLLGYQILMTNQIPINLSGSNTEIMFFNGPSIIVANGSDATVTVSTEGGYVGADGKSYFLTQTNEILIHLELYADCKLERANAASVLTGVTY